MKLFNRKRFLQLLALLPFSLLATSHAWSAPRASTFELAQAGASVGKSEAAEIAKAKYGGKVLKVEEIKKGNKTLYRVKLFLEGGRIKIVTVDSHSGKVV